MAIKGQVHWDKQYGGMSDTDTRMADGQYVYSEDIDIRRDPDYIQLAQRPTFGFTTPTLLTSFSRSIKDPAQIFLYGDQGAIFSISSTQSVEQLPGGEDILNATYFAGRHVFFYQFGQTIRVGCIDDNPPPTALGSRAGDPSFSRHCNISPIIPLANGTSAEEGVGAPVNPAPFVGALYTDVNTGAVYEGEGSRVGPTVPTATGAGNPNTGGVPPGIAGDLYVDTDTFEVWISDSVIRLGPQPGTSGVGAPTIIQGNRADFYVDKLTNDVYTLSVLRSVSITNLFSSPPCLPLLNVSDSFLYIGVENTVKLLTSQPGGLLVQDIIKFEDKIIGFTNNGNLIKVYLRNGRVYSRDGLGNTTQTFEDNDTFVRYVNNFGAYDYIVASQVGYSELYINQGLQFQLLKQGHNTEGAENLSKFRFTIDNPCSTGSMTQYQNIIYTGVQQGVFLGSKMAIASRGNMYNGYPIAHTIDSTKNSSGDQYDNIGMLVDGLGVFPVLVYTWEANGAFGVDLINLAIDPLTEAFQDSGVIYTQKYVLDHVETKRVYELDIRYGNTDPGKTIRIDYALDGGAYQNLVIIDENTDVERKESKFRKFGMNLQLDELIDDDFFEIQFKVTIDTDNINISPRLYDMRFKYEIIEQ